jgi:simple sugar transport system ATP-binding protein/ribose transport system ATP-binding protein
MSDSSVDTPVIPAIIAVRHLTKRFGSTVAVDDVSLDIAAGTVHALVGENGAGKSTLAKIIAGVHPANEGELVVDGEVVRLRSPRAAMDRGITLVAQELALVPSRSVLDNVFLGREFVGGPFVRRGRSLHALNELMERFDITADPHALVRDLSVAEQQKVELLRALARDTKIIILDEPTARLSSNEAERLHDIVRALADGGTTVIYVSHFLDEVMKLSDRISIMRDGRLVTTTTPKETTVESIIEAMIGRRLEANYPPVRRVATSHSTPILEVEHLDRAGAFNDITFTVYPGEIVGFAGLVGAGRTELVRSVFGAEPPEAGTVRFCGRAVTLLSPRAAIDAGMALIPESRKDQGLLLDRTIADNVLLPHLERVSRFGWVRPRAARRLADRHSRAVDLRASSLDSPVSSLSGGNQQKVLFARALAGDPVLIIADEPTRGVDVGAKRAIYELLVKLAAAGSAVLLVSSQLEEVLGLAHRTIVMRNGRIVDEIDRTAATADNIMAAAFGATPVNTEAPA